MGKLYRAPKIWDVSEGEQAQGLFEPEAINIPGLVGPLGMATDQDFIFMLIEIHVENQSTAQLIKLNIRDSSVHLYPPMAGLTVNTEDVFLHGGVRIAIDNQFIYWTDTLGGRIMRIVK